MLSCTAGCSAIKLSTVLHSLKSNFQTNWKFQASNSQAHIIKVKGRLLLRSLALRIFADSCLFLYTVSDSGEEYGDLVREEPLPFEVTLPEECVVSGTKSSRTYNQGHCSRKPCQTKTGPCSKSWQCCYEVGQTSKVSFSCSNSTTSLHGSTVVACWCQPCDKLQAEIRGWVLSSLDHKPIVLVAIMISDEIATFTDQSGRFFFQISTSNREVTLVFQEGTHRQVEVTVDIQHFSTPEVVVVMEYIETIQRIDRLQDGFLVVLSKQEVVRNHGVNVSLSVTRNSLVNHHTFDNYFGSGLVLHSLYHTGVKPEFTSMGLKQMIYRDSQGADFTIQSFVIGSLEIVDDTGHALTLKQGHMVMLSILIKFEGLVLENLVANIHLFTYVESESRWVDFGKVTVLSVTSSPDQLETWVKLKGKLRILGSLWAIGLPMRVSCYVKTRVFQSETGQELISQTVSVEQSDGSLRRPTYYHYSTLTSGGVGACLKSVCALDGLLSISNSSATDHAVSEAAPPDISTGIIMGDKDQIMFYLSDRSQVAVGGETPFYPTEEACIQSVQVKTGYFEFTRNLSLLSTVAPSFLPWSQQSRLQHQAEDNLEEYCFVKVAIYDCAPYTDVKALSYNPENHDIITSMHSDTAIPLSSDISHQSSTDHSCQAGSVSQLRASCVEYTCGSEVHVTVNSHHSGNPSFYSEPKSCRYWSSNSNVPWSLHPSSNMKVFHFLDMEGKYEDGLYHSSTSRDLALMKCKSGESDKPSNIIDPYIGAAVTFTCQF